MNLKISVPVLSCDSSALSADHFAELHVTVGTGHDIAIREVPKAIRAIAAYQGKMVFDIFLGNAVLCKLLDAVR